ncbi:hypothetical protein H2203_005868 [Taxawa tesnikishii (nom. ined.)]|nr:hypothetical protein H2203_005868 [Dothideales sp. JES 119]
MLRHSSAAELSLMDFYNYLTITLAVGLASYGLAHVVLLLCRRFTERAYSTLEKQGPAVEEFDEDDGEEEIDEDQLTVGQAVDIQDTVERQRLLQAIQALDMREANIRDQRDERRQVNEFATWTQWTQVTGMK